MEPRGVDYLSLQAEALFVYDGRGRITATNEPTPQPAPRLFLGRSESGAIWRVRADLPEATAHAIGAILVGEPVSADFTAPPSTFPALLDALGLDATSAVVESGPAYYFPDTIAIQSDEPPDGARVLHLTPADIPLLGPMGWDLDTLPREFAGWEPMVALVESGEFASLAFSARNTPRAAECGVDTLPAYRGRGYASTVVAAWAQAVRASARVPLYSTAWGNGASQAVARKLGLIRYGVDLSIF